ncbi:MAG: ABC transporter ATP-binding protein [Acidobacteriales bacterium]|nr:ABC transporter ATP-binding protein [Terriglobales bacterium]
MTPLIKAEHLGKWYRSRRPGTAGADNVTLGRKDRWALRDVSFEVAPGEIVGIIGHNGGGKSTLLKILARITCPSSGRGEVHGRVGMLLEAGAGLHGELTGRENVLFYGQLLGLSLRQVTSSLQTITAMAELEGHMDKALKRYSSGMCLRLAFAVCASLEWDLLLLDEPVANVDHGFQRRCIATMLGRAAQGHAALIVSHDLEFLSKVCTRTLVVCRGSLLFDGSPECATAAYRDWSRRNAGATLAGYVGNTQGEYANG